MQTNNLPSIIPSLDVETGNHMRLCTTALSKVIISRRAATFQEDISEEEWKLIGSHLAYLQDDLHFTLGDWLNYGRRRMKHWRRCGDVAAERYAFAYAATAIPFKTLANTAWVCAKVIVRYENLSWSHHVELAPLEEKQQKKFARLAQKDSLTVAELRMNRRLQLRECEAETTNSNACDLPLWIHDAERWLAAQDFESWTPGRRTAWQLRIEPLLEKIRR